jgi:hypothetical protein
MQSKLLHEADGKRTFAVILQKGDEAMRCLQDFAVKERLGASQVTAIGALSSAKLAFFDWESKQYQPIPVEEQVESLPLSAISRWARTEIASCACGAGTARWTAWRSPAGHVGRRWKSSSAGSPAHLCKVKDAEWAGADQRRK